jgi:hypothetical protein
MHWHEQQCYQCGQIIGADCMVVTTMQGVVHPHCWKSPRAVPAGPTFAEILAHSVTQDIVRQLLEEFMPAFEKARLVAKYTRLMQMRAHPAPPLPAHDTDEEAEHFLRACIQKMLAFLHTHGAPDAEEEEALDALLGQCGQKTGGECQRAGTTFCEGECPFSKGGPPAPCILLRMKNSIPSPPRLSPGGML